MDSMDTRISPNTQSTDEEMEPLIVRGAADPIKSTSPATNTTNDTTTDTEPLNGPETAVPPQPIPLRTLTVLLNYERMISDPKFRGTCLIESSEAVGTTVYRFMENYPLFFYTDPQSIQERNVNVFAPCAASINTEHPSTIVAIHPEATPAVQELGFAEKEEIFHETRGYLGSVQAIGLFQAYFDLCPPGQKVSIQLRDEEPIIIDTHQSFYMKWNIHNPKLRTFTVTPNEPHNLHSGSLSSELHCTMGFWCHGTPHQAVFVDMSRMHYSTSPFGLYGETYFIGTHRELYDSLKGGGISISTDVKCHRERLKDTGSALEKRLKDCAAKVFRRWNNRHEEGWCERCGKGGPSLINCPGCKEEKTKYCCEEHLEMDWALHQFTCDRREVVVFD